MFKGRNQYGLSLIVFSFAAFFMVSGLSFSADFKKDQENFVKKHTVSWPCYTKKNKDYIKKDKENEFQPIVRVAIAESSNRYEFRPAVLENGANRSQPIGRVLRIMDRNESGSIAPVSPMMKGDESESIVQSTVEGSRNRDESSGEPLENAANGSQPIAPVSPMMKGDESESIVQSTVEESSNRDESFGEPLENAANRPRLVTNDEFLEIYNRICEKQNRCCDEPPENESYDPYDTNFSFESLDRWQPSASLPFMMNELRSTLEKESALEKLSNRYFHRPGTIYEISGETLGNNPGASQSRNKDESSGEALGNGANGGQPIAPVLSRMDRNEFEPIVQSTVEGSSDRYDLYLESLMVASQSRNRDRFRGEALGNGANGGQPIAPVLSRMDRNEFEPIVQSTVEGSRNRDESRDEALGNGANPSQPIAPVSPMMERNEASSIVQSIVEGSRNRDESPGEVLENAANPSRPIALVLPMMINPSQPIAPVSSRIERNEARPIIQSTVEGSRNRDESSDEALENGANAPEPVTNDEFLEVYNRICEQQNRFYDELPENESYRGLLDSYDRELIRSSLGNGANGWQPIASVSSMMKRNEFQSAFQNFRFTLYKSGFYKSGMHESGNLYEFYREPLGNNADSSQSSNRDESRGEALENGANGFQPVTNDELLEVYNRRYRSHDEPRENQSYRQLFDDYDRQFIFESLENAANGSQAIAPISPMMERNEARPIVQSTVEGSSDRYDPYLESLKNNLAVAQSRTRDRFRGAALENAANGEQPIAPVLSAIERNEFQSKIYKYSTVYKYEVQKPRNRHEFRSEALEIYNGWYRSPADLVWNDTSELLDDDRDESPGEVLENAENGSQPIAPVSSVMERNEASPIVQSIVEGSRNRDESPDEALGNGANGSQPIAPVSSVMERNEASPIVQSIVEGSSSRDESPDEALGNGANGSQPIAPVSSVMERNEASPIVQSIVEGSRNRDESPDEALGNGANGSQPIAPVSSVMERNEASPIVQSIVEGSSNRDESPGEVLENAANPSRPIARVLPMMRNPSQPIAPVSPIMERNGSRSIVQSTVEGSLNRPINSTNGAYSEVVFGFRLTWFGNELGTSPFPW